MQKILFAIATVLVLLLGSCKGDGPEPPSEGEHFDKEAMLQSIATSQIVPAYEQCLERGELLDEALAAFRNAPDANSLDALQQALRELYLGWQACAPFEFGPASAQGLKLLVNTFPADTAQIRALIAEGNYDLYSAQNTAAKGLPALEYLIFEADIAFLQTPKALGFLEANSNLVRMAINATLDEWKSTYHTQFTTSTGSDVGSSLGLMVNALNQDFELIKNAKVGIPLGKKTLGVAQPEKVEAPFSMLSLDLCAANVNAIRSIIEGKGDGLGLGDYLDALQAKYNDQNLSDALLEGFDDVDEAIVAIPGSLQEAIESHPSAVDNLHGRLQNLVILLKTDMPSQMGIQITYQDNDGD